MQLFSLSTKSLVVPEAGAPPTIPLPTPDMAAVCEFDPLAIESSGQQSQLKLSLALSA